MHGQKNVKIRNFKLHNFRFKQFFKIKVTIE